MGLRVPPPPPQSNFLPAKLFGTPERGITEGHTAAGARAQRARCLTFQEKFRWHTQDFCAWRGLTLGYPNSGTLPYLLGPDVVYQVTMVASSIWVPEERSPTPEVFIIREGINFTIDDPTRSVYSLHKANIITAQVGIRKYKE